MLARATVSAVCAPMGPPRAKCPRDGADRDETDVVLPRAARRRVPRRPAVLQRARAQPARSP